MILEAADELKNSIDSFIKKTYKYFIVILLYILYQSSFLIMLLEEFGLKITSLPKTLRIFCFGLTDMVYILILLFMFRKEIINGIKDLKKNFLDRALLSLNCWIVGSIIMAGSSILISLFIKQGVSENEALVREGIKLAPLYMLFTCSIVAPIFEEMVFRMSLGGLIKFKWLFILVSGLSFGLLHVLGSWSNPVDFIYIVPYGAMGCAFAYLYKKTDNIALPIIIHMIHNTVLVLAQILGG